MSARRQTPFVVAALAFALAVPAAIWASSTPADQSRAVKAAQEATKTDKAATAADPAKAAVAVSEKFLDALAAGDGKTVCAVITAEGRDGFTAQGGTCERAVLTASRTPNIAAVYKMLASTELTTDGVLLAGAKARVEVTDGHTVLLTLDPDGTWRVGGLT